MTDLLNRIVVGDQAPQRLPMNEFLKLITMMGFSVVAGADLLNT
jgi:hypothetical protein